MTRQFTEEHKEKLRQAKLKNPVRYWKGKKRPNLWNGNRPEVIKWLNRTGQVNTKEHNEKVKQSLKNNWPNGRPINSGCFKKGNIPYNKNKKIGPQSEDNKRKKRISMIKYIKETCNGMRPNIGKNEAQELNKWENIIGYKILRQYPVCGYFLDGYCKELNLAIEIDEQHHKKQLKKDKIRQQNIENELGCCFIRIEEGNKL